MVTDKIAIGILVAVVALVIRRVDQSRQQGDKVFLAT